MRKPSLQEIIDSLNIEEIKRRAYRKYGAGVSLNLWESLRLHNTFVSDLIGIRFRDDDDSETAATWRQTENTDDTDAPLDTNLRIRFEIQETGGGAASNEDWQLEVDVDGGGFNPVNATSNNVRSSASGNFTDGDNCTQQMGGSTPFLGTANMESVDGLTGQNSFAGNDYLECEFCYQIRSADLSGAEVLTFRVVGTGTGVVDATSAGTVTQTVISVPIVLTADVGTFTLTGIDTALSKGFLLTAALGTYTLTGIAAILTAHIFEITQESFRGRNDDGSETTATWKAAVNVDWTQNVDENFRVRFLIQETGPGTNGGNIGGKLQYNLNSAGWVNVSDVSSVVRAFASANFADQDLTTQQLGSGTFVAGRMDEIDANTSGVNINGDDESEIEYCLQIISADVVNADIIDLRLVGKDDDVTLLDGYTNSPIITVNEGVTYILTANVGAFAFTGPATNLLWNHALIAALGTYTLAGIATNLNRKITLIAALGTYALTGPATNLLWNHALIAALGTYALTGIDVALIDSGGDETLTAAPGAFALTGPATSLLWNHALIAALGTYTLAGIATNLEWGHLLTAALGTYTLTGIDLGLKQGFGLVASAGTFSLAGIAANLLRGHQLVATLGTYNLAGIAVVLTKSGGATHTLTAALGTYNLVGVAAGLQKGIIFTAELGTFALSGFALNFLRGYSLQSVSGQFVVSGTGGNLLWSHQLVSALGTFILTGNDATGVKNIPLAAALGTYALAGIAPAFLWKHRLPAGIGVYSLTGLDGDHAYRGINGWRIISEESDGWSEESEQSDSWSEVTEQNDTWSEA